MDTSFLLAAAAAVVLVVLVIVLLTRGRRSVPTMSAPPLPTASLPADVRSRIDGLVSEGRTIEVIKQLRAATGLGLADAKRAIDGWATGGAAAAHDRSAAATTGELDPATVAEVDALLAGGRAIPAIKVLRERTGWGLREAKERIDRWETGRG